MQCGHIFRGGASRIRSHLLGTKDGVSACDAVSEEDKQKLSKIAQKKSEQQLSKKRKTDLDNLTRSNSDPSAASTSNSSRFNPITSAFHILFVLYAVLVPNTLKTDKLEINIFLATILQLFCQYCKILRIMYYVLRITCEVTLPCYIQKYSSKQMANKRSEAHGNT